MNRLFRSICVGLSAVCCVALGGCGGGGGQSITRVPVSGKVTLDGAPVTSGQVSLVPVTKDASGLVSAGQITNGEYKIFTGGKEGAPPGKYKVTVTPSMVPVDGKMPAMGWNKKFMDSNQSTLSVEVKADAPPGAYDLKLTK
jgi:hypothetical protein